MLFKGSKNTIAAKAGFSSVLSMCSNPAAVNVFLTQQYECLILDEAHEYTVQDAHMTQSVRNNYDRNAIIVHRSAFALVQMLPNIAFTLLVTATPCFSARCINQWLFLMRSRHTTDFDTLSHVYSPGGTEQQTVHIFPLSTDLSEARVLFMQHHVVTTNAAVQRAIKDVRVTYKEHILFDNTHVRAPLLRYILKYLCTRTSVHANFKPLVLQQMRPQDRLVDVHAVDRFLAEIEQVMSFGLPHGVVEGDGPAEQLARQTTFCAPLFPNERAFASMIVAYIKSNENNRVLVYIGNDTTGAYTLQKEKRIQSISGALEEHGITMGIFRGQLSHLKKKRKLFDEQKYVMMIGKQHIAGMNVPDCSHILIFGNIEHGTDLTQLIGRARRYNPDKSAQSPVEVVRFRGNM
jgi:hypothetical protein